MKEMTLETLLAVFEEMFGRGLFWAMVVVAAVITLAFALMLLRERRLIAGRLLRAEISAPVGAVLAVLFVQWITSSGFRDVGGAIDMVVLLAIAAAGGVGFTILTYVAQGILARSRGRSADQGL
jgi:hypothetical protein